MQILKILTPKRIIGNAGEKAAIKHLRKNKYKIVARNYIAHGNEIDIIAQSKEFLVFVEVKSRTTDKLTGIEPRPSAAVTPEKQRRIIKAARYFLACNPEHGKVRFDVIEVYLTKERKTENINHIISAFGYNSAYLR